MVVLGSPSRSIHGFTSRPRPLQKKHRQSRSRVAEPSPYGHIYNINPVPKVQEILKKLGRKDNSKQRMRGLAVKLCLLRISETTHMKNH